MSSTEPNPSLFFWSTRRMGSIVPERIHYVTQCSSLLIGAIKIIFMFIVTCTSNTWYIQWHYARSVMRCEHIWVFLWVRAYSCKIEDYYHKESGCQEFRCTGGHCNINSIIWMGNSTYRWIKRMGNLQLWAVLSYLLKLEIYWNTSDLTNETSHTHVMDDHQGQWKIVLWLQEREYHHCV